MKLLPHSLDDLADCLMAAWTLAAEHLAALIRFDVMNGAELFLVQENTFGRIGFLLWRQCIHAVLNVLRTVFPDKLLLAQAEVLCHNRHFARYKPSRLASAALSAFLAGTSLFPGTHEKAHINANAHLSTIWRERGSIFINKFNWLYWLKKVQKYAFFTQLSGYATDNLYERNKKGGLGKCQHYYTCA